jgi:uncharacterized membrane protein YgcG
VPGRSRKLPAGLALLVAGLVAWNDGALLERAGGRRTQVAGVSVSGPGAAGIASDGGRADTGEASGVTIDMGTPPAPAVVTDPAAGDVAIAPPPPQFEAPAAPPEPPPPVLRSGRFDGVEAAGGTWAVMIGIDDYPGHRHDLRSAVADAGDVNEALRRMGVPGDHRLLLRNGQATAETIRTSVEWLNAHAGPDAVAVFFYAGHIRSLGGSTEAIVAADGVTIPDHEMAALLGGLKARRAWIALAACYAGGFTEVLQPGRVLTAAAPAGAIAYENEQFGRSYLVEYMVRRGMIEGQAGSATIEGAFAWARAEIARDYPNRVPVQYDEDPAELDLRPQAAASARSDGGTSSSSGRSEPASSGGSGSGDGSGSGSGGGGSAEPPPPSGDDGCARYTLGVVRCDG